MHYLLQLLRSNFLSSLVLASTLVVASTTAGCGSDTPAPAGDPGDVPDPGDPPDDPPPLDECPLVGNLVPTLVGPTDCELGGVLTEDGAMTSGITWFLDGGLQVGSPDATVTLDVEGGTEVRGNGLDYVLVFPGSALQANGTSAAPVRFLSDDDGVDGSGEWGGLFLRGFNGLPTLDGDQGANRLDYVVVAEGGAPIEITIDGTTVTYEDNVVLNGVDRTTTLTFVQSHNSARDGFHVLNGDPRMSWLLATGSGRDGVWYRDFSGLIKDLLVVHSPDADGSTGRAGIYASETLAGDSNPRIVNATLVGRDSSSELAEDDDNEFGILFADNTDQIRLGNVLIANFRNGCFEADSDADLSGIDTSVPGPVYLDGVHCANEAGANPDFGVVRDGSFGFPDETIAPNNSIHGDGLVYYNGAANAVTFTGEFADRRDNFTAGWYLANIGGVPNGLAADSTSLNGFLDGDTNNDGSLDVDDTSSPFIIADDGPDGFNQDVADDTGGYDLTHIGAVRGGAITNVQFDGWTVATGSDDGFAVQVDDNLVGESACPSDLGGADVFALDRIGGRNACEVSGILTADATMTSDTEWFLDGGVQVGDEFTAATLTIESGTRVYGGIDPSPDYLLVSPGSSLRALGTGARPVRFTSDDPGIEGSAEWGGVFLRGYNGLPTLSGTQGQNLLDYVVVAEAGAPSEVTIDGQTVTYQDNVVLNGVDRETILTFVQSHNSSRDGFHILNGDPRMSWLLATGAGRDGVWYRDFTGLIKDLLVIHDRDADGSVGRSGIYASETADGASNPRIVNATLVGRNSSSEAAGDDDNEFGILFADNTDQIRLGNVLIANFRNGCYAAVSGADLRDIDTDIPGPTYLDGVHCANEAGANPAFGIVDDGSFGFGVGVVAPNNFNGDGFVYYNGAGSTLPGANTPFEALAGGINFTGEIAERRNHFTSGWYLDNIRGIGNGLVADADFLNGFLDGDSNLDGLVDSDDTNSPFIITDDGPGGFNQDVAADTGGYDLTHVGAVRGGAVTNTQFDNWTVATLRTSAFTVRPVTF